MSHATAATPLTHTTLPPVHRAAGFKQLIKDARLELKVYDITQMTRLFNLKGGAKGIGLDSEDGTSLGVEQFLTLLINLAFYRENPRYTHTFAGCTSRATTEDN